MADNKQDELVKEFQDLLDELIKEANDLRENGVTAYEQAAGSVAQGVLEAQKIAASELDQLAKDKSKIRNSGEDGWEGFKDNFHDFFAKARVDMQESKIERDIKTTENKADKAEDNAVDALNHTIDSLKASRVAVLDALAARAKADELAADLSV